MLYRVSQQLLTISLLLLIYLTVVSVSRPRPHVPLKFDPFVELLEGLSYEQRKTPNTHLHVLGLQTSCHERVEARRQKLFESPHPADYEYKTRGFRQYGDSCNYDEEQQFYYYINEDYYATATEKYPHVKALAPKIVLSLEWFRGAYAVTWNAWLNDTTISMQVCNPKWMLRCDKDTNVCGCFNATEFPTWFNSIEFERELIIDEECTDAVCDLNENKTKPGYRCVAKSSETGIKDVKDKYHGCYFRWELFDLCSVNCNYGSQCMTFPPELVTEDTKHLEDTKVCCDKTTLCKGYDEIHSEGYKMSTDFGPLCVGVIVAMLGLMKMLMGLG